jgi:protein SDA1
LKPHQVDVTLILAICAQASHDLVPPDAIEGVIKAIMDNFVMDACAAEVIAAGLNGIREICSRCPLAMETEVLAYLITFKTNKDKGAAMAARSLIALYREVNPEILPRRERGKVASMDMADGKRSVGAMGYGHETVADGVEGAELLNGVEVDSDDDAAWEVQSDEGSDAEDGSDDWVKVNSDSDGDIVISEGESDDGQKKSRKRRGVAKIVESEQQDDASDVEMLSGEEDDCEEIDSDMEFMSDDELELVDEDEGSDASMEIDGSDNQDSDVEQDEEESKPADDGQRKSRIEMTRFLTPADFALMKKLKEEKQAEHMVGLGKRARSRSPSPDTLDNIVSTTAIESSRKRKQTREERIEAVMEGRKDRPKFGSKKGKDRGSTTNKVRIR